MFPRSSERIIEEIAVILVGQNRTASRRLVSGATVTYSQYHFELNYCFIDCDVIRVSTICRLSISFLHPPMDDGSMTIDTQSIK